MAANPAFGRFKIEGLDEIRNVLKTLPQELQDKVMRVAVGRAARPLVSAAKLFAGRSAKTGALRESIGAIVKKGKRGGVYAVIGPRHGYYRSGKALGAGADKRGAADPGNYGHLVEFGHHVVAPVKGTSRRNKNAMAAKSGTTWVTPRPFMRPALLAAHDAIIDDMAAGISEGIKKQLDRLVKNPKAAR